MGKQRKNRVRAQRKFAQGAYVPPQSTPVSAPTQVTVNAGHRALSLPGPVTKNVCSATDLLTRMSLGKSHNHYIDWPIVILKDCVKSFNIETEKKKLTKKRLSRRLLLRNARKHVSDVGDRDSSESDSAEDTPLSHLQNTQVTPSKLVKNVLVGDTEGTTCMTTKTDVDKDINSSSAKIRPKRTTNGNTQQIESKNKFGLHKVEKIVVERRGFEQRNILTPPPALTEPPKTRSLKRLSNPESSSRKTNLLPSSPRSKLLKNRATMVNRMRNMKRNGVKRNQKKSCLKSLQTPVKKTRKICSASNKKKEAEKLFMEQLAKDQPALRVIKTTKYLLHLDQKVTQPQENIKKLKINKELVNDEPDLKDNNRALEDTDDSMIHKLEITNIKTLNEDFPMFDSTESTDIDDLNGNYPSNDLDFPIQTKEDMTDLNGIYPSNDHDMAAIHPEADMIDLEGLHYPSNNLDKTPIKPEEDTIDLHMNYPFNDLDLGAIQPEADIDQNASNPSNDLDMPIQPEEDMFVINVNYPCNDFDMALSKPEADLNNLVMNYPSYVFDKPIQPEADISNLNANHQTNDLDTALSKPESDIIDLTSSDSSIVPSVSKPFTNDLNSCNTSEVTKVNSLGNDIDTTPIQPESNIIDLSSSDSFKVPSMPARFTRHAKKQCPLQHIADLHELLSSEVACNNCRRCTLITKYKQILKKVPKSRSDEPDIQDEEQLPPCPFESDDESTFSFLTRRRQKVCYLLTSKKLIIWLINPQIDLDNMRAFKMEHAAGSLKLKLNLYSEEDVLVDNVINRIDYLNRCIVKDNMVLNLEKPMPRTIISEWERTPTLYVDDDDDDDEEEEEEPPLVYRPTLDEFKDPITYINSIQKKASKNGICKIIPPDGFHVPCHLDEDCVFGTTNQHLGRLYHRWGPNTREFATIQTSMTSLTPEHKERFTKAPLFGGIEVDLVKLYHLILEEGGIQGHLSRDEKWARIAAKMNLVFPNSKLDWKKLENIYCKHVLPYESLTFAEREAAGKKVDKIWEIRVKNLILRASQPLHYQHAMLSETSVPEYEERDFPDGELADLYDLCKPIFDKIEECTGKGRSMNLATFRRISKKIEAMRFPNGVPSSVEEIEKQYWDILNLRNEHVCVLSAFIDTSVDKLGHESDPKKPGGSHPWNLKRIGENPNNILHSLGKALSVTVPTMCLNQMFSTSCWHKDPHKLAWMDYMHEGATKIWYSVPVKGAPAFRRAVQMVTEATVQDKGIWLASDTTMIPPGYLTACGVPYKRIEQNPNEFIVVFPGAYACSISTGLSVAESIYFENSTWLDHVEKIFEDLHKDCEPAMFSSVRLIMNIARNPRLTPDVLKTVTSLLKKCIKAEFQARREAQWLNVKVTTDKRGREEGDLLPVSWPNQEECCLCRMPLVLSKMSKYDQPRKQMCIAHGTQYMRILSQRSEADRPEQPPILTLHYTNQELIEMMGTMEVYNMSTD